MTIAREATGFFGKVPSHGDFVARRLPAAFTGPWDTWLQAGLADSRARLGAAWLPAYLNSPIWRFAIAGGVCGPQAWGGVMMPSVDRVGRYFPLTIAGGVDAMASTADRCGVPARAWYAALEELALSALGDGFSLQHFDASLLALAPPPAQQELFGLVPAPHSLAFPGGQPSAPRQAGSSEADAASLLQSGELARRALFWIGDDSAPLRLVPVWGPQLPTAAMFTQMLYPATSSTDNR